MNKTVFIYSLNCPFTNQVKYVGKTQNTLVNRLSAHVAMKGLNFEKELWIKSLKEKSTKPIINLLEITDSESWQNRERHWINHFLSKGSILFNKPDDLTQKEKVLLSYKKELIRMQYRENTQKNYCIEFEKYLYAFEGFDYPNIKYEEIIQYLEYLVIEKKISASYQNTIINAIKFYYEKVLNQPRTVYHLARPRKTYKIRPILSIAQVDLFLKSITNIKQRTAFQIMYSGALRSGEVVSLLIKNIDFENGVIKIVDSKGGKDRIITLPMQTINLISEYIEKFKPKPVYWLFDGQKEGTHYTQKSIQEKFGEIINRLGFDQELRPHDLRHSRISHTLNNGVKLEMASKQAGHESPLTTSKIYHHYDIENMREQYDDADKKIMEKLANANSSAQLPSPKLIASIKSSDKIYQINLNGKVYDLTEKNNKIASAPEGAKWSIGVVSEKAIGWFQKKGAQISIIKNKPA